MDLWQCGYDSGRKPVTGNCRGSRVGCFVMDAGGTPAATELLRRERGDDFFEARLAAQRVPPWHQF